MFRALPFALLLAGCAPAPGPARTPATAERSPVILVSLDGFRSDYLDRGVTPTLTRLAREGARAEAMVPVFPTKTFPNHYTIVTGRWPANHGIVGNEFTAPELGARFGMADRGAVRDARFWGAEPIWVTAERQGVRTAPLFWPGSEAAVGGVRPSYALPYDHDLPDSARVRQVLQWLDRPPPKRPAFLTLYTSVVDAAGHDFGPDAPETRVAIAQADSMVGLLAAGLAARGLEDKVNLVIVSDHGMTATAPDRVIELDTYLDRSAFEVDAISPVLMAHPRPGLEDSVYRSLRAAPHLTVYRRADLPARYHLAGSPRVAPIVALADEGWVIRRRPLPGEEPWEVGYGDHGYDDSLASMRAIFVARGPGFRRGLVVPRFRNIHVYPLLAELLGLRPAETDGSLDSVRAMLAHPSATSGSVRRRGSARAATAPASSSEAPAPR
ncbi:MAG: alkaline phosphatase family protein [Gemmatimonadales bacterium]|nr:alkaline phosphatase family protein [Gemmatimonadales bacterium]